MTRGAPMVLLAALVAASTACAGPTTSKPAPPSHVAKAQVLGAGLGIGAAILNQIFPGTGVITPLAGQLVTSQYSRSEEYEAAGDAEPRTLRSPAIMPPAEAPAGLGASDTRDGTSVPRA